MTVNERSPLIKRSSNSEPANTPLVWVSPTDPTNPKNWPASQKWGTAILVSFYALAAAMSPAMIVPAIPRLSQELNLTSENSNQLLVSIYVLSWCLGPLFWAPLSEAYGRLTLLNVGTTLFLVANLLCGFEWIGARFLALRFVAGFVGSSANAIGGGLMSDLWRPEERGQYLAVYAVVPLLGSAVGAIFGGWVVQSASWRWLFWGSSAFVACCLACGFLVLRETFAPVILRQQQKKLLGDDSTTPPLTKTLKKIITTDLPRPFVLVGTQPIIWALGLYMAYLWDLNFLMISTYQVLWQEQYGQTSSIASLTYISISLGFVIGCELAAPANDKIYAFYKSRNNIGVPEFRTRWFYKLPQHLAPCQFPSFSEVVRLNAERLPSKIWDISGGKLVDLQAFLGDLLLQKFSISWHAVLQLAGVKRYVDSLQRNRRRASLKLYRHA